MKKVIPFPVDLPIAQAVIHNYPYTMEIAWIVWIDSETGNLADWIEAQTVCIMNEIVDTLAQVGWNMENIVKSQIFVTDLGDFNVINKVYKSYFWNTYPVRFVVQVAALPLGAKIEIQCSASWESIT